MTGLVNAVLSQPSSLSPLDQGFSAGHLNWGWQAITMGMGPELFVSWWGHQEECFQLQEQKTQLTTA